MAEIVNLRRARKQKGRMEAAETAAQNRTLHGRTKSEKKLTEAEKKQHDRKLDAHHIEPEEGDR